MKLIHLSDLHLGKRLGEASLMDDQRHILTQVLAVIDAEQPDGVLVAGDVYDKPVPPAEAVGLLDDFITQLAQRGLPVILISGNHDSAERLAFGARLFSARGVTLAPALDAAHAALLPVRLTDALGTVAIWPLPFLKPAHVRAIWPDAPADTLTAAIQTVLATLPLNPEERNVLLCHQYLTGGERSDSEETPLGGLDGVDAAVFDAFDYVALGHLHRAQQVGRPTVRYAGSPLKYSFSEARGRKTVTVVELAEKGSVRVREVPLAPLRDLREVRGTYAELTLLANYRDTPREDYLRITLTDEFDRPEAFALLQSIYPNLLRLDYDNARTRAQQDQALPESPENRDPLALLAEFYQAQNGLPLTPEQRAYALEALEALRKERA